MDETHTTETWFRNPDLYVKEFLEVGARRLIWDEGFLVKRRIDPLKFVDLWFPAGLSWRMIVAGREYAREYRPGDAIDKPTAVYPVWNYGEDFEFLETQVAVAWGEDEDHCADESIPRENRPIFGQEHRVIVGDVPIASTGPGKRFLRQLAELQREFPDTMVHVHGLYGFKSAYGLGFNAVDIEPRTLAKKGKVVLPMGREMRFEQTTQFAQWITIMGFSPVDLSIPRNRCMYNIKSAMWAGEHYMENFKFKMKGAGTDPMDPSGGPPTGGLVHSGKAENGDKFLCDTCSLSDKCKYYRTGAVCSIPDSEPADLSRMFMTRDADTIIGGLGTVLAAQTRRAERGMQEEEDFGELDPEVTRILNSVFTGGVKLAKLLNPALNGGPKVGVFVGAGGNVGVTTGNPSQLTAKVVAELESRGVPRDKITSEMIINVLSGGDESKRQAIEAHVTEEGNAA